MAYCANTERTRAINCFQQTLAIASMALFGFPCFWYFIRSSKFVMWLLVANRSCQESLLPSFDTRLFPWRGAFYGCHNPNCPGEPTLFTHSVPFYENPFLLSLGVFLFVHPCRFDEDSVFRDNESNGDGGAICNINSKIKWAHGTGTQPTAGGRICKSAFDMTSLNHMPHGVRSFYEQARAPWRVAYDPYSSLVFR